MEEESQQKMSPKEMLEKLEKDFRERLESLKDGSRERSNLHGRVSTALRNIGIYSS